MEFRKLHPWIEEEFNRIVARLAVDIHGAGKIGSDPIVKPVVIGEPGVFAGNGDEIAGARMGDAGSDFFFRVHHFRHAAGIFQQGTDGSA